MDNLFNGLAVDNLPMYGSRCVVYIMEHKVKCSCTVVDLYVHIDVCYE